MQEVLLDADADMKTASLKTNLQNGSDTAQHSGTAQSAPAAASKQPELHNSASDTLTDSEHELGMHGLASDKLTDSHARPDASSIKGSQQRFFTGGSAKSAVPAALQSDDDAEAKVDVMYDHRQTPLQQSLHVLPAQPNQSDNMLHKVVVVDS